MFVRDYILLPKKELHSRIWVRTLGSQRPAFKLRDIGVTVGCGRCCRKGGFNGYNKKIHGVFVYSLWILLYRFTRREQCASTQRSFYFKPPPQACSSLHSPTVFTPRHCGSEWRAPASRGRRHSGSRTYLIGFSRHCSTLVGSSCPFSSPLQ